MPRGHVIVGDMNAGFGQNVKNLLTSLNVSNGDELSYPFVADDVIVPKDNVQLLSAICVEKSMVVVNNLKSEQKHFLEIRHFGDEVRGSRRLRYAWHRVL